MVAALRTPASAGRHRLPSSSAWHERPSGDATAYLRSREVYNEALEEAHERRREYAARAHVLPALLDDGDGAQVIGAWGTHEDDELGFLGVHGHRVKAAGREDVAGVTR